MAPSGDVKGEYKLGEERIEEHSTQRPRHISKHQNIFKEHEAKHEDGNVGLF